VRDSQREKVYQAEYRLRDLFDTAVKIGNPEVELDGIRLTLPPEAKFADMASIQAYVDRVIGTGVVTVRERRSAQFAHYEPHNQVIAVPDARWAMREIVLLHELAHHVTHTEHMGMASHGPEFVYQFAELLGRVMGAEVGLAYRILCGHSGVKFEVKA
jgi:putative metallohydrolase (TIGR04338 family)